MCSSQTCGPDGVRNHDRLLRCAQTCAWAARRQGRGTTRVAQNRPVLCSAMGGFYQWGSCSSMGARTSRQAPATAATTAALMMVETASPTMTTWSTTMTLVRPVFTAWIPSNSSAPFYIPDCCLAIAYEQVWLLNVKKVWPLPHSCGRCLVLVL